MTNNFLKLAIDKSRESVECGGFPVGAVIVLDGEIIATGISNGKALNDPTSHAEVAAIREACAISGRRNLGRGAILYSSMEPCLMCYSASIWASIPEIVYAVGREKLSPLHFEGNYNTDDLNAHARNPRKITHATEHEEEALDVVRLWERSP